MSVHYRACGRHTGPRHAMQLFDAPESRDEAVAAFLHDGFVAGNTLLVVLSSEIWSSIEERLRHSWFTLEPARAAGRLVVQDEAETLSRLVRRGIPDEEIFEALVGGLVRELASRGRPVRIYGEMVGKLAERGEFRGARLLEEYWNRLGEREPFDLLCGYPSASFGDPRSTGALRSICETHSHVVVAPNDLLGAFLLDACAAHPTTGADSTPD